MVEKINVLKKRLTDANIKFEEKIPENPELSTRLRFEIPAARENHECVMRYRDEILEQALSCKFEKYRFLKGYEAIWSNELNIIEAEVGNVDLPSRLFFNRLSRLTNKPEDNEEEDNEEDITSIELPKIKNYDVSMGYCTPEFAFLSGTREQGPQRRNFKRITLKISNTSVSTHDKSLEILVKIANSLFFQIDLTFEIPINLQTQRDVWLERRNKRYRKQMFVDETARITEPKYEYDSEPISLYWYAKESQNMPIFQYLAYYQSIEFYFPVYASFEAKQKIQSLIKDPRFNANRDADITKLISTIKLSNGGKSYGNEKDQLKATIKSCTDNAELMSFLKLDNNRYNFYAENKGKKISVQKISVKNETADLVTEIADRIYEIRCRIVHSKASEGDFDVLLPYSNEIKKLNYDLELLEFISRKVLIASSRPLNL